MGRDSCASSVDSSADAVVILSAGTSPMSTGIHCTPATITSKARERDRGPSGGRGSGCIASTGIMCATAP